MVRWDSESPPVDCGLPVGAVNRRAGQESFGGESHSLLQVSLRNSASLEFDILPVMMGKWVGEVGIHHR